MSRGSAVPLLLVLLLPFVLYGTINSEAAAVFRSSGHLVALASHRAAIASSVNSDSSVKLSTNISPTLQRCVHPLTLTHARAATHASPHNSSCPLPASTQHCYTDSAHRDKPLQLLAAAASLISCLSSLPPFSSSLSSSRAACLCSPDSSLRSRCSTCNEQSDERLSTERGSAVQRQPRR